MDSSLVSKVIQEVQKSEISYCKFLAPNDTKYTKAHQAGYLISKSAWQMFLDKEPLRGQNIKANITIKWQDDFETFSTFTYYGAAKNEFRLTGFGRNFPFREEENSGDLFILCRISNKYFKSFILSHDENIEDFLAAFNISPNQTNAIIPSQYKQTEENGLIACFKSFLISLKTDFPSTLELSSVARKCYNQSYKINDQIIKLNPDREILKWLDAEFQLFKIIENERYSQTIKTPFKSVEDLVDIANTILNRRKSRAGKSLEHHLAEIFNIFNVMFDKQAKTEKNKIPDFLFPNEKAYKDPHFINTKLLMLAAKTTCKDRWRQILNEADRIKIKHLFTLQPGISKNQLDEMYKYDVCLVVPQPNLETFPKEYKDKILTLSAFITKVKSLQ